MKAHGPKRKQYHELHGGGEAFELTGGESVSFDQTRFPDTRVSGKRLNREIGYGNFPARTAFSQRSKIVRPPCKNHSVSHASPLHTISASNFSFTSPGSGDMSGWFVSGQFKRFIRTRYYLNLELSLVSRPFLYIVMFIQLDCETLSGIKMEINAAITSMAGTWGPISRTQIKETSHF